MTRLMAIALMSTVVQPTLTAYKTAVQAFEADLGFAFDGDADRVMAVDNRGRTVNGDYILYFWGQQLKQQQQTAQSPHCRHCHGQFGF